MQAQQPELFSPSEKRWSKSQPRFSEARVPVIPRGLVAARVLAFQTASGKTWSTNSRMFSTPKLAKSQEIEVPSLMKRKPNYKSSRNPCKLLSSVTQPLSSESHQSSIILSISKPILVSERGEGGSANSSNLGEEDVELQEQVGLFGDDTGDKSVDKAGDILGGAMDYQAQGGRDSNGGPEIEIKPSTCLNALDGDVRLPEANRSQLNMLLTKTSVGGSVEKSNNPFGSSRPHSSTLLEASTESKKYRFWSERKEKSLFCDSHEDTRAIGPHIDPHSLLYSNGSAARSQQALNLGTSDPTVLEIRDAIELHYLSPGQVACSRTGESTNSFVHRNFSRTLSFKEAKPLETTTPTRNVHHSMSATSMRPPSQLSRTHSTLKRWSWWKLGGRKQSATGVISGNSREDCINPIMEREQLESFPTQPIGYGVGTKRQESGEEPTYSNDPTCTFQISKEPETIVGSIGSAGKGTTSPKNNEIQSRSWIELPLTITPPEVDLRPSPDLYASPSFAADTLSQEGFSDTSTIQLQPDKSSGAVRWRNRGQNFQRVQLVVNLDMRELVVKGKVEKKGKGKLSWLSESVVAVVAYCE